MLYYLIVFVHSTFILFKKCFCFTLIFILIIYLSCNNVYITDNQTNNCINSVNVNFNSCVSIFYDNLFLTRNVTYNNFLLFSTKGTIPPDINSGINDNFQISILLMCFLIKLLNRMIKNKTFLNIIFLVIIKLISSSIERDTELIQHLKDSTKIHFFTIETIKVSNCVSEQFLETNLCFLCISKIRYRNYSLFFQLLLLLSGDINPNPGPQDFESNKMWEPFVKRGLHFIHINVNSMLPKIDELRSIAKKSNAAVIGITESKLDESVLNSEIHIDNYSLIRCDRNRHGGGVACYVRDDISYNQKTTFNSGVENIFIDILLPKTKPFTVGIFYRPPDKSKFIETITEDFYKLNAENNDLFILGDMNINLINSTCPLVKKI